MCKHKKKLVIRILPITFLVPALMILFVSFIGPSIKDAFHNSLGTLFQLPFAYYSWLLLILINIVILKHMKPIINFWGKFKDKKEITMKERNRAMCSFNSLGKAITLMTVIGFTVGIHLSTFVGEDTTFKFISAGYVGLNSTVIGFFTSMLINMSLNNALFPVKSALMVEPPDIKPKYVSFYKQLLMTIMLLLAFLGFQILSISIDLYSMAVSKAQELLGMGSEMENYFLPEFFFTKAGKAHKATSDLLDVFGFKIIIFVFISLRTLSLIKKAVKNPLDTVENRLEALSSDSKLKQNRIAIVNNDEFSTIYSDINKLIDRQQVELEISQERLHSVIDNAADPIVSFDSEGHIFIFNPAAEEFFKWSRLDIKGTSMSRLFDPESIYCKECEDESSFISMITDQKSGLQRFAGLTSKNEKLSFEANFSKSETPDGVIYTAVIRDISGQMEFEEKLKTAKVSAERANRLKSEFLANMSHELRTPLNAVLGFTQLLTNDKNLTDSQLEKIGIISRSGEHLLGLINDILDISKIEAGKIELHETAFNVRNFVEDLRQMLDLKCKKKGLALYVEYVDPLPEYVKCDLGKLRQILINILGNAIKFTKEGGISVVVGVEDEKLKFSINDTGKGIPENEIESILQPFTQSSLIDHEGGTGLGLAITNSFIQMMGGKLLIESKLNEGSTFSFSVDMDITDEVLEEEESLGIIIGIEENRHPNVLIVDDKLNNRLILKEMLERVGFVVMEAENGKVAIERAREISPEIIFMDIKMPVMDGYEAVKQIKNDKSIKSIPVFALTASAFKHDEKSILESGFDGFLAKPFKQSSLFHLIHENSNIRFVYEKEITSIEEVTIDSLDMKLIADNLTQDQLNSIEDLAIINDFTGIKNLVKKLMSNDKLNEFISVVSSLADNFDDENLERLIENIKETK